MKVKIIGLLLGILMLTGCSATYNLEITEDTLKNHLLLMLILIIYILLRKFI